MNDFSIVFVNKSGRAGTVCLYQGTDSIRVQPEVNDENKLLTLAWFTKKTNPGTKAKFGWNYEFCFVWDDLIDAEPGRVVDAGEIVKIDDPSEKNGIMLSKKNGAYQFGEPFGLSRPGLYIRTDSYVARNEAVAGIGMAGLGTFVRPMGINSAYEFFLMGRPEYHIAFGDFETGQILDTEALEHKSPVAFPPNVYSMLVTLNEDNSWTAVPNRMLSDEEE